VSALASSRLKKKDLRRRSPAPIRRRGLRGLNVEERPMRTRLISVLSLTAALAAGPLAATAAADTPALPTETGCPVGQALTLDYLSQFDYNIPFIIDAEGNNDRIVCGVPLPEAYQEVQFPNATVPVIYLFRDNTVTSPQNG
jgi:hypothetical protein